MMHQVALYRCGKVYLILCNYAKLSTQHGCMSISSMLIYTYTVSPNRICHCSAAEYPTLLISLSQP